MKKSFLIIFLLFIPFTLYGCSSTKTSDTPKSNNNLISATPTQTDRAIPFILDKTTIYPCPFAINNDTVTFPNWEDNNKISIVKDPLPTNFISTKDVVDFVNYSTNTLTMIDGIIYFGNSADGDALSSINMSDKTYKKLNNNKVHNLIASNQTLFYINKDDNYKLYSYDVSSTQITALSSDRVGNFIINGDYIIYQNLSDKAKLYKITKDGKQKELLTDFSVDSFVVYNGQLLVFNSSDNNNLYLIDPTDLSASRIALMRGEKIKVYNDSLYFINFDDSKHLYSLTVDINTKAVTSSLIYDDGVNEYYPTEKGIFIEKGLNINNTYIYIVKIKIAP